MPTPAIRSISLACLLVALAACESPSKVATTEMAPVDTRSPAGAAPITSAGATAATAAGAAQSGVSTVDLAQSRSAGAGTAGAGAGATALMVAPAQRIVYFDFDSYVIKDEFKAMLDGHALALKAAEGRRMVIEGHTDERGGREYNLALGQKRAEAVAKALELLGVPDKQVEAVSFGEERPAIPGTDEGAWSRNRRAELKDR